jgi:hypothetical protein
MNPDELSFEEVVKLGPYVWPCMVFLNNGYLTWFIYAVKKKKRHP